MTVFTAMDNLNIQGTVSTPTIRTDYELGIVELLGDSYPENSFQVYSELMTWIEEFLLNEARPLRLSLELLYLNTSSIKVMMDIFDLLQTAHDNGRDVAVVWRYMQEDERVSELALEFKEDCTFPFDVLAKQ
jgi:hypothetical protein